MMNKAGLPAYLMRKYVDDILIVTEKLELGARWKQGRLVYEEADVVNDSELRKTQEEVTYEVLRTMANTVFNCLEFTGEYAVGHNPILCLDIHV